MGRPKELRVVRYRIVDYPYCKFKSDRRTFAVSKPNPMNVLRLKSSMPKAELQRINQSNPEGWTIDLNMNPVDHRHGRWVVAMKQTQRCGINDAERVRNHAALSGFIGVWTTDEGLFYLDAVDVFPSSMSRDEALVIAVMRQQISIYDLHTKEVIMVPFDLSLSISWQTAPHKNVAW